MANINLVTSREESSGIEMGTVLIFLTFIAVLALYAGLFFYDKKLETDKVNLEAEYKSALEAFLTGDSKKVFDFQNRLTIASSLVKEERSVNADFLKVEGAIIDGVYLDSYKYDDAKKTITLDCYAQNYETVAKQILGFKGYDYFSAVLAGETDFDAKNNRIKFVVVLTVK